MKAVLLEAPPISGTYPEQWYRAKGECTFALFEDAESEEWLGVFGNGGITQYSAAISFPTTACVLVIARGKGYAVDIQTKQLRYEAQCDYLVNAVEVPARDLIVACDFTRLYAFSSEKQLWQSDNIASDGIELGEVSESYVRGKVWQYDQWLPFTLKVDELSIELGKVK